MTACSGIRPSQALGTRGTDGSWRWVASTRMSVTASRRRRYGSVAGEVAAGRHHLHAGQAQPHEGLVAGVVAELGGELHRVLADLARRP